MPYSISNPPAAIKDIPDGAKKIFIAAFNAAYDSVGQNEAKAFKIAWSAVGKKYKKDADGKWTALEAISLGNDGELPGEPVFEVVDLTTLENGNVYEMRIKDIAEITFEGKAIESEGRRFVWLKMMKPGWSFNGNYWTPKAAASMAEHVMREGSRKLFVDHRFDADAKKYGRSMREWVATSTESRVHNGVPLVKTEVFIENEPAKDLWEKITKYPEQVGTSVDARVRIRNGEAEGRKGHIVEEVVKLNSLDFVNEPSAGGGVVGIAASVMDEDTEQAINDHVTEVLMVMEQVAMDLASAMKSADQRRKFWDLQSMLSQVLRNIVAAPEKDMKPEDKKKAIKNSLSQFVDEMGKLDMIAFENKQVTGKNKPPEEDGTMAYANLEELKKAQPELLTALTEQIKNELKVGDEAKAAEAKVTELTTANTTLTTENKRLTEEVKGYKDKEVLATRIVARDKMIEEAKIPAAFVSDDFRQSVREAADDTRAAAIIKDRQTMAKVAEDKVAEAKKGGKPDFHTAENKTVEGTDKKESKDFDPTTYRKTVGVTEVKTK